MPVPAWIAAAGAGAAKGAKDAMKKGEGARGIAKGAAAGAGIPSFGGARDRAIDKVADAAPEVIGRAKNFLHGLGNKNG